MTAGGRIFIVLVVLAFVATGFYYLTIADGDGNLEPSTQVIEPVAPAVEADSTPEPVEPEPEAPVEPEPLQPLATGTVAIHVAGSASAIPEDTLAALLERFDTDGPESVGDGALLWRPVHDPAHFAEAPELLEALASDPAGYFRDRFGLMVRPSDGRLWMLLHGTERSLAGTPDEPVGVLSVEHFLDADGREALAIELDETTRRRLAAFSEANLSRPAALLIDSMVVTVRPLGSDREDRQVVDGDFPGSTLQTIADAATADGELVALALPEPPPPAEAPLRVIGSDDPGGAADGAAPVEILAAGAGTWTVASGDSLSTIAESWFGTASAWTLIAEANPSVDPNDLAIGQVLVLPARDSKPAPVAVGTGTHRVRSGENLSSIAKLHYGEERLWSAIHEANRDLIGDDPGALEVDMVLVIPRRSELEP